VFETDFSLRSSNWVSGTTEGTKMTPPGTPGSTGPGLMGGQKLNCFNVRKIQNSKIKNIKKSSNKIGNKVEKP
jgi:hypothetical protein